MDNYQPRAAQRKLIMTGPTKMRERAVMLLGIMCAASPLAAQTVPDTGGLYSGIAFSVAGIVIMVLLLMLYRRFDRRKKSEFEDSGLNLMSMKQKNLLTPEEMRMVSAAIARRMAEKDAQKTSKTPLTTATLLHDPEVLRLQQEAMAKRQRDGGKEGEEKPSAPAQQESPAWNAMPAPVEPPSGYEGDADPAGAAANLDDVELPPEVQQLADAGILTEEEIENVKRRLRARG